MADNITTEELEKEIKAILDNENLENTSTKKVILKLEKKLGVDLSTKRKLIDQLVMDYVNSMDSEEDDDMNDDDSNDSDNSDWGYYHDDEHLLNGYPDENCYACHQESTIAASGMCHPPNRPRIALVLKRVTQTSLEEDEADTFGKLTAKKLRKLSDEERDSMMIQINQLFYDKCHKPANPPKPKMEDKATSTPRTMYEMKKLYRMDAVRGNLTGLTPIAPDQVPNMLKPLVKFICENIPKPVVSPSNVPEPVVQVAMINNRPVIIPAYQEAAVNTGT